MNECYDLNGDDDDDDDNKDPSRARCKAFLYLNKKSRKEKQSHRGALLKPNRKPLHPSPKKTPHFKPPRNPKKKKTIKEKRGSCTPAPNTPSLNPSIPTDPYPPILLPSPLPPQPHKENPKSSRPIHYE